MMDFPQADWQDQGGRVRLYRGECLRWLELFPDSQAESLIADPPYSSGGAFRGDRMLTTRQKYVDSRDLINRSDFGGDNRDSRSYGYWCALWLGECLRVVREGGTASIFTDWRQLPITTDALQAGGWVWRGIAPWDKTEAARPRKGLYRNQCEYVVWGTAGAVDAKDGPCLPGYWRQSVAGDEKHHIAGKPLKVMEGVVEICPVDGLVIDPFMGSGSTGVAAVNTGRRFVGIERDSAHFEKAQQRISEALLQPRLFSKGPVMPTPPALCLLEGVSQ